MSLIIWIIVTEHKHTFFRGMRMKVYVVVKVENIRNHYFESPNCRLVSFGWLHVEPIQVLSQGIKSIVTSRHTIWVQSWYNFEHKVFPEHPSLLTSQVSYHFN